MQVINFICYFESFHRSDQRRFVLIYDIGLWHSCDHHGIVTADSVKVRVCCRAVPCRAVPVRQMLSGRAAAHVICWLTTAQQPAAHEHLGFALLFLNNFTQINDAQRFAAATSHNKHGVVADE